MEGLPFQQIGKFDYSHGKKQKNANKGNRQPVNDASNNMSYQNKMSYKKEENP